MANSKNLKPFAKNDKRINRKGRPKTFDALRSLAQQIAHKEQPQKDGSFMTTAELILIDWATSKEPSLQIKFVEYAWGKVPQAIDMKASVTSDVKYTSDDYAEADKKSAEFDRELLGDESD